tara:strand:- start:6028 stop:6822 length:795 start_codon:yes stop_codon:yes gene_type:complete
MKYIVLISFVMFSLKANAQLATFDAYNAKLQTLHQLEFVKETEESIKQTQTMLSNLSEAKKRYDAMISSAGDYKDAYNQAKKLAKSAEEMKEFLGSFSILKENGIDLDFSDFGDTNDYVDSLYTHSSDNKELSSYGKKLRNYETNEYAKNAVAKATEVINKESENAEVLESLTAKYQSASNIAEKEETTNKILLELVRQIQVMTHLQAQMNKVVIAKETKAIKEPEFNKWTEKDTMEKILDGGSHVRFKADSSDEALLKKMGIN